MGVKILAGFVAAVAVTAVGVYVAFSGGPEATADTQTSGLPVSEGSCCAAKLQAGVCPDEGGCPASAREAFPTDALAACTGGVASGLTTPEAAAACQARPACCSD